MTRRTKQRRKTKATHGLCDRNFPRSVRDRVDIDYHDKLSQSEKEWLSRALDQIVGADFTSEPSMYPDKKARSAAEQCVSTVRKTGARCPFVGKFDGRCFAHDCYYRKNRANEDIWGKRLNVAPPDDEGGGGELSTADIDPEYLGTEEYKAALAAVREQLPQNEHRKPTVTPKLRKAYAALERTKKSDD